MRPRFRDNCFDPPVTLEALQAVLRWVKLKSHDKPPVQCIVTTHEIMDGLEDKLDKPTGKKAKTKLYGVPIEAHPTKHEARIIAHMLNESGVNCLLAINDNELN